MANARKFTRNASYRGRNPEAFPSGSGGNFLLQYEKPKRGGDPVLTTLAELIRKLFNARNFKGLVSPHEFLQAVRDRFRVCRSNASEGF